MGIHNGDVDGAVDHTTSRKSIKRMPMVLRVFADIPENLFMIPLVHAFLSFLIFTISQGQTALSRFSRDMSPV